MAAQMLADYFTRFPDRKKFNINHMPPSYEESTHKHFEALGSYRKLLHDYQKERWERILTQHAQGDDELLMQFHPNETVYPRQPLKMSNGWDYSKFGWGANRYAKATLAWYRYLLLEDDPEAAIVEIKREVKKNSLDEDFAYITYQLVTNMQEWQLDVRARQAEFKSWVVETEEAGVHPRSLVNVVPYGMISWEGGS